MTKNTIFIVSLEDVPTRYTCQWKDGLPLALTKHLQGCGKDFNVISITGTEVEQETTPGAFLNFSQTNIWKSEQLIALAQMIQEGRVRNGDRILFTDAWNPAILQIKYMIELLRIDVSLLGIWHAGSYDPQDFLGRLIKDKRWSLNTERALFHALDTNIFATVFHKELFINNVLMTVDAYGGDIDKDTADKILISGQPHESMIAEVHKFSNLQKRDLIIFPHRVAPEKQVAIFRDLALAMPEYEFIVCQDTKLTKDEYHTLLGESKIVFSANLQETLGISSCIEAPISMSLPLVPDRLSYQEIFDGYEDFKYPSYWTIDWHSYQEYKDCLITKIKSMMANYDLLADKLTGFNYDKLPQYATGNKMFAELAK